MSVTENWGHEVQQRLGLIPEDTIVFDSNLSNGFIVTDAENNTWFVGSDHSNKACYKDSGGTVHELY